MLGFPRHMAIVFDTSFLIPCCEKLRRLNDEEIKALVYCRRALLSKEQIMIVWYITKEIFDEYEKIPSEIEKCRCLLSSFDRLVIEHFLRRKRQIPLERFIQITDKLAVWRVPKSAIDSSEKCVTDLCINLHLDLDEHDKKFLSLALSLANRNVWLLTVDKGFYEKARIIIERLRAKVHVVMPNEFLAALKSGAYEGFE